MILDITIRIIPRKGLLDPEGKAVQGALHSLGFDGTDHVRAGRLITMRVSADSEDEARELAEDMCRKLLANPVTEDFAVDVKVADDPDATNAREPASPGSRSPRPAKP